MDHYHSNILRLYEAEYSRHSSGRMFSGLGIFRALAEQGLSILGSFLIINYRGFNIRYVKNKISKRIGIMYKARNCINKKTLLVLYHSDIYILTSFIALNLGATHQIVTLILYLLYKSAFLESSTFPAMMFHQNHFFKHTNILPLYMLVHYRIGV